MRARLGTVVSPKLYKLCICALALGIAFLIPLFASEFIVRLLILSLIFTIYSSAWNLLVYSGQGSIGHAAYFGAGAYASTLIAMSLGLTPFVTIFLGGAFAAVVGLLTGLLVVRLREWFFGMATFAFAIIFQVLTVDQLASITGGWDGLFPPALISSKIPNYVTYRYYAILFLATATIFIIYRIMKSRIGLAFTAIRENELEARVLGIPVMGYKLLAFVLSTFFAGIAGSLQVHHFGYLSPEIYAIHNSFSPVICSITGGMCTIEGPIIGTFFYILLLEGLRAYGTFERFIVLGVILILILIFMPKGLTFLIQKGVNLTRYRFRVLFKK